MNNLRSRRKTHHLCNTNEK